MSNTKSLINKFETEIEKKSKNAIVKNQVQILDLDTQGITNIYTSNLSTDKLLTLGRQKKLIHPYYFGLKFSLDDIKTYDPLNKTTLLLGDYLFSCDRFKNSNSLLGEQYYQLVMEYAIRCNNLVAINCMWNSCYHNYKNPNYRADLECAIRHGNLTTISLVLSAINLYATFKSIESVSLKDAISWTDDANIIQFLKNFVLIFPQDQDKEYCINGTWKMKKSLGNEVFETALNKYFAQYISFNIDLDAIDEEQRNLRFL